MRVPRALALLGALLLLPAAAGGRADASPAPIVITVDRPIGKAGGWSIGYSDSLRGCLAAATFGDGTTIWFGFEGGNGRSFLAFTNESWRSLEVGNQYDLQIQTRGAGQWHGTFTGFQREEARGLFQIGLKDKFVADLSGAGSITLVYGRRRLTTLSLVGSTEALDAVLTCQKSATTVRANTEGDGPGRKPAREAGTYSSGTGFYVSARGHVLTNQHVVDNCQEFQIRQPGKPPRPARLVASDATNDLAVLSTDEPQARVPPLSVRARVGESVFVFGFPQTSTLASTGNFTIGNVTATAGMRDDTRMIQISAPVHMGNSGGPVLDRFGNVLGVIRSKATVLASNDVAQNVNFAIKTTVALNFLDANGIEAPIDIRTSDPLDGAEIAEKAREFTVQVTCR